MIDDINAKGIVFSLTKDFLHLGTPVMIIKKALIFSSPNNKDIGVILIDDFKDGVAFCWVSKFIHLSKKIWYSVKKSINFVEFVYENLTAGYISWIEILFKTEEFMISSILL